MTNQSILVVDDEAKMRRLLEIMLTQLGHVVYQAADGQEALDFLSQQVVDLLITDLRMPKIDGIELLRQQINQGWGEFIGSSPAMKKIYTLIQQVSPTKTSMLIQGETGTGKELVARAIHQASPRSESLFVAINCAAIPADILESELFGYSKGVFTGAHKERMGKFELADGGTLFLDEVTEMDFSLQAKLLRVLQERSIERLGSNRTISLDDRVIAATNRNPKLAIEEKKLREDLYYRLNVFTIVLPGLSERQDDILLLANHFLQKHAADFGYPFSGINAEQKLIYWLIPSQETSENWKT